MFIKILIRTFALLLFMLACSVIQVQAGTCTQQPAAYNGYTIQKVSVDVPLNWLFGSVRKRIKDILAAPQMPQQNKAFLQSDYEEGFIYLQSNFNELSVSPTVRVAFKLAWPRLQNCDDQKRTLEIVYKVYTFGSPYYASRTFEDKEKEELGRAVVETPATRLLARIVPLPFISYDRSRNLSGGLKVSIRQLSDLVSKIDLEGSGSSSSAVGNFDAAGSQDFETGLIRHKEWHLKYQYSDQPGKTVRLKQGTGIGQFSAATRSFGTPELVLRFGGLIEGGNRQSEVDPARVSPSDVLASKYRGLKGFVGSSMSFNRQSLKASYGIQVGSASEKLRKDFVKQVFDVAYDVRFLPWNHRPINLDVQFTAGRINTSGRLPVSEKFFGGNVEQNFIADESWIIRGNPFIRSFPQNRLETVAGSPYVGGDRFFSANVTLTATVWGYPLVPDEVLKDPEFPGAVQLEMSVAQGAIQYAYLSDTAEFKEIASLAKDLPAVVKELKKELVKISNPNSNQDIQDVLDTLFIPPPTPQQNPSGAFDRVEIVTNRIVKSLDDNKPATTDIETLAVGDDSDPDEEPLPSQIEELSEPLRNLEALLPASDAALIRAQRVILDAKGAEIKKKYKILVTTSLMTEAENKAKRDMAYPRKIFNELAYEINIVGLSPVVVFDAASIWQRGPSASRVRYAAGGGLRVSFFNVDLTTIYAWNIHRLPGEGRGALTFQFGISNLFR
jgi:hypothetical protein